MIFKYKVFATTLLFRVYLSVKENDKSITHREGWICFEKVINSLFQNITVD